MSEALPFRVLLYYWYTDIADPEDFARNHLAFCTGLGLLGRILVAKEGINGTVSGSVETTTRYMEALQSDPRFHGISFKIDQAEGHVFRKMTVKARNEIVRLGLEKDVNPRVRTGKRLSPREFREALQQEDVLILDARNAYEYDVGHFRGAIRPTVKTFRDFPGWVREVLGPYRGKKVLTYCTGGIRCEKFSAMLLDEGFTDVSQLDGGIITYGQDPEVQGELFEGSCYVFDERATVPVNHTPDARIVGKCRHCGDPCERFVNCAHLDCDNQYLCCIPCEFATRRSCSDACRDAENHEFDPATAGTSRSFYR